MSISVIKKVHLSLTVKNITTMPFLLVFYINPNVTNHSNHRNEFLVPILNLSAIKRFHLIYKGESVCVCVCVCVGVCVCMSGGLPPDLHNQSPWNLAWAPHFTLARHRAKGRPQMLTPGGTPIVTPSEKPWRVKNWAGASKQKLLLGVGLQCKILFVGGSPQPWAHRVHTT